jgi:sorting nexin-29
MDVNRIKFNLEKLIDPNVAKIFEAKIGGRFAPLLLTDTIDTDVDTFIDSFNTTVLQIQYHSVANEVLGKKRTIRKPWVTPELLKLCDERRELKKSKYESDERADMYRKADKQVKTSMLKAKEDWITEQCNAIETNFKTNNTKKAFQVVKNLTRSKQSRPSTILDKNGKCLTESKDILNRWTEYTADLYSHCAKGDMEKLNTPPATDTDSFPILREEVEEAVRSLKKGKSAGIDNIPGELVQAGGEAMIDTLHTICQKIWSTGEWPTKWTQSLVITLPKKGNLQHCNNYRTISLICHPSKVMLRIILNRLRPQAEAIIAEEQAGFRKGRSTTEQIFNLRILCEKYQQHQQDLYHVFIDFKKAFDRVWHAALWATMNYYNINANLIRTIQNLYEKASSAIYLNGEIGEWFRTTVGVRQGCLLSPILFNIFLERIMTDALENHQGTVSIGGRTITNLRFADDIDGLAGSEQELENLVKQLDRSSTAYGMEISANKTKTMTNNVAGIQTNITANGDKLETVKNFKYLGAIVSDEGSKPEILARIAMTAATLAKFNTIWKDKAIKINSKIRLLRSLIYSVCLYACETWTLTAELEKRIQALEMRCYRRLLGISYKDHITNEEVKKRIRQAIGPYEELITTIKRRKLKWFGHVTRGEGLTKTVLQGTVRGGRKRGRQKKRWENNITEWTGMKLNETFKIAKDRDGWRKLVDKSSVAPQRQLPRDR